MVAGFLVGAEKGYEHALKTRKRRRERHGVFFRVGRQAGNNGYISKDTDIDIKNIYNYLIKKGAFKMRIVDLLKPEAIKLNQSLSDKSEAIEKLIELHASVGNISDIDSFRKEILKREELSSTAVGNGIAIPHAKSGAVGCSRPCRDNRAERSGLRGSGRKTFRYSLYDSGSAGRGPSFGGIVEADDAVNGRKPTRRVEKIEHA